MTHKMQKKYTLLMVLIFCLSACTTSSSPTLSISQQGDSIWSSLETQSIFQSQVMGNHLLLSTDAGLVDLELNFEEARSKWLLRSRDLILNHTISATENQQQKRYFYLERHALRFYDINLSAQGFFPKVKFIDAVSTKRYGTLLDGATPSRYTFSPNGKVLYIARYGQLLAFKPGQAASDSFIMPNFASYLLADNHYVYYRTFEREKPSSHVVACIDMKERKEVWCKYFGPNFQEWHDIVDSFPLLSDDDQIYIVIRAYPLQTYDKEGLFVLHHMDKENGELLRTYEITTPKALGARIPIGPLKIISNYLLGEIHAPALLTMMDLEHNKEIWTMDLGYPLLDIVLDENNQEWVCLLEDGSVKIVDMFSGEYKRSIPLPEEENYQFSYGQIHITDQGYYAGHLNNKAAYTIPRAIFFAHR